MFEPWLAARDAAAVRTAWRALASRRHEVGKPGRKLTLAGAAQLAGAMLGTRADWIVESDRGRTPEFTVDRIVTESFLDGEWDVTTRAQETWRLHEQRDGDRGAQVITISAGTVPGEGRPEGGGQTVVRVFDRDRAASVCIDSNAVWTIGEIDLAPLDLFSFGQSFAGPTRTNDVDMMRALVAQIASELDAHFDTSPQWPCIRGTPDDGEQTFGDGERSITVNRQFAQPYLTVHGLPWGHRLQVQPNGIYVHLPDADIDRVLARLAAITSAAR